MRPFITTLLVFAVAAALAYAVPTPKEKIPIPKGVRVIEMPGMRLKIIHEMGADGPLVRIDVDGKTVEAKRIFIGDGKEAIEFGADEISVIVMTQDGGKSNHRQGGTFINAGIGQKRGKTHPFERMREGDIYIINSPFKVSVTDEKGK